MKIYCLLFIFVICQSTLAQQDDFLSKRNLRVWNESVDNDTVINKLKYDKTGAIKLLDQSYSQAINDTIRVVNEHYKKNKFWIISQFSEVSKKNKKNYTVYQNYMNGKQYQYYENGQIMFVSEYKMNKQLPTYLSYAYYPNGNLKYITEAKDDAYWNIVVYKYLSGEDYDYGNFNDGIGTITHLDDKGNPCIECNYTNQLIEGNYICDQEY